jgi:hypothetical protein
VTRVEGGVPEGARIQAVLTVDGKEVSKQHFTLARDGALTVPFTLPDRIDAGRGQIALTLKDGGVVEAAAKTIPISLDRLAVTILPEGGELVAGLPGRVYYSVRDPAGEPADLLADVVDSRGTKVAETRVTTLGMGRFDLTPRAGETYRLAPREPKDVALDGASIAAVDDGVALRSLDDVARASGALRFTVSATVPGEHAVAAWCRGVLVAQETVRLARGEQKQVALQPTSDVGGVFRVTVFDPSGTPRAERLISRVPARRIDVSVSADAPSYVPGEHVKLSLRTRDETGKAVPAVLGVTVVDDAVLSLANDEDTPSLPMHFLLGLEVEELEKVEVFAAGADGAAAVDLLLGVQGWRRFAWVDADSFLAAHPDAGARVIRAGAASDGLTRVDNLERARWDASGALGAADQNTLFATLILLAGVLLGGIVMLLVKVPGSRPAVALASVGVAVLLLLAVLASAPLALKGGGGGVAGDVTELARATLPVNGQEVLEDELFVVDNLRVVELPEGWVRLETGIGIGGGGSGSGFRFAGGDILITTSESLNLEGRVLSFAGLLDLEGDKELAAFLAEVPVLKDRPILGRYFLTHSYLTREYAHTRTTTGVGRKDFTEVLYWDPLLATDAEGRAEIEFDTSDSITTFSVEVEAHDGRGALAAAASSFENRVPFYVEPKLPAALSTGDRLRLPVAVANDTKGRLEAETTIAFKLGMLRLAGDPQRKLPLDAGSRGRVLYDLVAKEGRGAEELVLTARAPGGFEDTVTRRIEIAPRGYPVHVARAGVLEKVDATALILPPQMIRQSLAGTLKLYPSTLASLTDGLESMLAAPHGCFEQASSTTYPNVLILTYLEESGDVVPPAVARRAREYLGQGYRLLTGYECENRGFEWFGNDPGHEGLTAYGLMEFSDMARVHQVDADMLERTRDWILARRDGEGGFEFNRRSLHSWVAKPEIVDAYVTWSLTEADRETDLKAELDSLERRARKSDDPYVVALTALALANRDRPGAKPLLARLARMQGEDGSLVGKSTSIVASRGKNLAVETTALAALAFLRDAKHLAHGEMAVRWLLEQRRRGGRFGATQATILALRALVAHGRHARQTSSAHDLTVFVNGKPVANRHVAEGEKGVILFEREVLDPLVPGRNEIEVRTTGEETLPWALSLTYHTLVPPSDPTCAVGITTALDAKEVGEGETVGMTVTIDNREDGAVPMTLARIGLPAGLVPRPDQLTERKEAGDFDFYETRPREVALYLRGLKAGETKLLRLDLTAEVPGAFEGPATSAYLYYTDDVKTWAAPLRVRIRPAR